MAGKCCVCGQDVVMNEDATCLDAIAHNKPNIMHSFHPRHIRCSPSRAQYITAPEFGEPVVDTRPDFDKRLRDPQEVADMEVLYTAAWGKLQEESAKLLGESHHPDLN